MSVERDEFDVAVPRCSSMEGIYGEYIIITLVKRRAPSLCSAAAADDDDELVMGRRPLFL